MATVIDLPNTPFQARMREGHHNRMGHALDARLVSFKPGEPFTIVRLCCETDMQEALYLRVYDALAAVDPAAASAFAERNDYSPATHDLCSQCGQELGSLIHGCGHDDAPVVSIPVGSHCATHGEYAGDHCPGKHYAHPAHKGVTA